MRSGLLAALLTVFGVLAPGLSASTHAEETSAPPDLEATLQLKILSYDRNLKTRSDGKLVIGVVYLATDDTSARAGSAIASAFRALAKKVTVQEMKPSVAEIPFDADLGKHLGEQHVTVVYLAPGLDSAVASVTDAARAAKAATLTGRRSQLDAGVAVAVVSDGKKPKILVNLSAAKKLGMDLDPNLLKLAEVKK